MSEPEPSRSKRTVKFLFFVLPLITVILCTNTVSASGQAVQVKPDPPRAAAPEPVPPSPQPKALEGVGAAVDPNTYQIGSEDVLYIQVWKEPDFTRQVAVRPDGKITMPLIGDIQASGLTPLALTADLKEKVGKYVQTPEVTVTVIDVRSRKYYIDGEVGRPGAFALVTPTKVLEALSLAGGFREFANQKNITILRGAKTFKFNYKDVIRGKHLEENIFLENGDHIIVK
jgi:polysaccharide export outer membrane protein